MEKSNLHELSLAKVRQNKNRIKVKDQEGTNPFPEQNLHEVASILYIDTAKIRKHLSSG